MATYIKIDNTPAPGTTIPTGQRFSGTFALDNAPLDHIHIRVIYPPAAMLPGPGITIEEDLFTAMLWNPPPVAPETIPAAPGTWGVILPGLQAGIDVQFQAELWVSGGPGNPPLLADSDTIEDLDVIPGATTTTIGVIGTIAGATLLPTPLATIP